MPLYSAKILTPCAGVNYKVYNFGGENTPESLNSCCTIRSVIETPNPYSFANLSKFAGLKHFGREILHFKPFCRSLLYYIYMLKGLLCEDIVKEI